MKIKPITLKIEKEIWDKFKDNVPSSVSLNDALIQLIQDYLKSK